MPVQSCMLIVSRFVSGPTDLAHTNHAAAVLQDLKRRPVADAVGYLSWPLGGVLLLVFLALTGFPLPAAVYVLAVPFIVLAFLLPYVFARRHYERVAGFVRELAAAVSSVKVVGPWGLLVQLPDGLIFNIGHGTFLRLADRTVSFWKFFRRDGTPIQLSPEEVARRWKFGPSPVLLGLEEGDPLGNRIESLKAHLGAGQTAVAVLERPRAPVKTEAVREAGMYIRIPRWIEKAAAISKSIGEVGEILDGLAREAQTLGGASG